jgi:cell division septal protein FtsQ
LNWPVADAAPAQTKRETGESPFYRPRTTTMERIRSSWRRSGGGEVDRFPEETAALRRKLRGPARMSLGWKMILLAVLIAATAWAKARVTESLQNVAGLKLAHVKVTGAHYLDEGEVLETAALPLGENMYKLDLVSARARLAKLGWVQRVYLERRLPRGLVIALKERRPAALLDSFSLYGVDAEGRVLPSSRVLAEEDLPLISGVEVYADAVGTTRLADSLKDGLGFLTFLDREDSALAKDVSEVSLAEKGTLRVTFLDGMEAKFGLAVTELELKRMAAVLSDQGSRGRRAASMDFRYRDTVIVRSRD